jgi:hypothetical protein
MQALQASPLHGLNQWPSQLPSFETVLRAYVSSCLTLGANLLRGLPLPPCIPTSSLYFHGCPCISTSAPAFPPLSLLFHPYPCISTLSLYFHPCLCVHYCPCTSSSVPAFPSLSQHPALSLHRALSLHFHHCPCLSTTVPAFPPLSLHFHPLSLIVGKIHAWTPYVLRTDRRTYKAYMPRKLHQKT